MVVRREGEPSSDDYDWDAWEALVVYCLRIQHNVEDLIDYWKANGARLDYAKNFAPQHWQRIVDAFKQRRQQLEGTTNG